MINALADSLCEGGSFRNENPSLCVTYSKDRLNAFTLLYCFQSHTVGLSYVVMSTVMMNYM